MARGPAWPLNELKAGVQGKYRCGAAATLALASVKYQEPEFLPWDGKQVPLTFVGGYLGAGKTTAINELLARSDRPIAVLVNDIGSVNIDASLIRRRHGDTIELTDGCVCCSLVDGFGAAFDQIRSREVPPDQVVVELSGVAEPERMIPWGRSAGFFLDGIVVLVDVDQFETAIQSRVKRHLENQITQADQLVLTKQDLADSQTVERVRKALVQMAPTTPIVGFAEAMATAGLLSTGGRMGDWLVVEPETTLFDAHQVTSRRLDDVQTLDDVETLLDGLPSSTVRAKGIVRLADGSLQLIHQVGSRRSVSELSAAESQDTTDLVVITVA